MVVPSAGLVVLVPFPFSDLSRTKLRPAIVLASAGRDDWVLCQVTSNPYGDTRAIVLARDSFLDGMLRTTSYARPGKLFTANRTLVTGQAGRIKRDVLESIVEAVISILRSGLER